jgi:hypothetical protein
MNQQHVAGIWQQLRGNLLQQWGVFTRHPEAVNAGIALQDAGRDQVRYALMIENSAVQLRDFLDRNRHWEIIDR